MEDTKICPCCREAKLKNEYNINRTRQDGLNIYCQSCSAAKQRARYHEMPSVSSPTVAEKLCRSCCLIKPAAEYQLNRKDASGLRDICRGCRKLQTQKTSQRRKVSGVVASEQRCAACGITKLSGDFNLNYKNASCLNEKCKDCMRIYQRYHLYGLTSDQFDTLYSSQQGCCAICANVISSGLFLQVDHSHTTGTVRGLLCNYCNMLLANAKDSIEVLQSAVSYLQIYTHAEMVA
jgi:hypothetical protein